VVRRGVGGVHDQEVALGAEAEDDQVVQHAAALVAEDRVLPVADAQAADVVHGELLADRGGRGAAQLDLAHVAHVEEPAVLADRAVLLRGAAVGEWHLPPRELDQARAERAMGVEERRAAGHARAQSACSAALTVLASSIATVIGPTPPGTGVMWAARSQAAANSTSPQSLPSGPRFMPTSIAGGSLSMTGRASSGGGSGSWTRMPCTSRRRPSSRTRASSSACPVLAASR